MGWQTMPANIRGGGKAVHVVFKYLSLACVWRGGIGWSNASPPPPGPPPTTNLVHPISLLLRGDLI
jgi:hypothetical protein